MSLPILSEDDLEADDEPIDAPKAVLITGAAGNIGRKLTAAWADRYDLTLIDAVDTGDEHISVYDLSTFDPDWVDLFEGIDVVVHLAGNPDSEAPWEHVAGPNLDAMAHVLNASALAGVERVVFASSNHAMGAYRDLGDGPITEDLPPRPDGDYGASKLVGERLGVALADAFDLTFVALRLGWNKAGDNPPEGMPDAWSRSIWLSNGDLVRAFTAAVEAPLDEGESVVANAMSANRRSRWDLSVARERLGYVAEDSA